MTNTRLVIGSLITRSKIILFAMVLSLFAAILGMVVGAAWYGAFVGSLIGIALGAAVAKYRQWECNRIVPGMGRAQALAAIQIVLLIWLLLSVAWMFSDGPILFGVGLSLCMLAFGMCVGTGEMAMFLVGCAAMTLGSMFFYKPEMSSQSSFWSSYSTGWMNVAGAGLLLMGAGFLWRFWKRTTEWDAIGIAGCTTQSETRSFANPIGSADQSTLQPLAAGNDSNVAVKSRYVRLKQLLLPTSEYNWKQIVANLLIFVFVMTALMVNRGKENATMIFQLFSAWIIIIIPATVFLSRTAESFERLWLIGESSTRVDTLRRKLELAAWYSLVYLIVILAGLAIQSPPNWLSFATTVSILLISFGLGAVALMFATRIFRFWKEHSNAMMLICIGIMLTVTLLAFFVSNGTTDYANSLVERAGIIQALLAAMLFAVVCWGVCIWDGARAIANDSLLME